MDACPCRGVTCYCPESRYVVVVPFRRRAYVHDPAKVWPSVGPVATEVYPKGGVSQGDGTYDREEAEDVLSIFTKRWVETNTMPPRELTPYARRVSGPGPDRFTLFQARPWTIDTGWGRRPAPAGGEDDEDD